MGIQFPTPMFLCEVFPICKMQSKKADQKNVFLHFHYLWVTPTQNEGQKDALEVVLD